MFSKAQSIHFNPTTLSRSGEAFSVDADSKLRSQIASELGVIELNTLKVEGRASIWKRNGLKISGTLDCALKQECVATLEPVSEIINVTFDRYFLPEETHKRFGEAVIDNELVIDAAVNDDPDELPTGGIDVWDVILEEINLELDPFPRKADIVPSNAVDESDQDTNNGEKDTHRPFSDLNALINEKKSKNQS